MISADANAYAYATASASAAANANAYADAIADASANAFAHAVVTTAPTRNVGNRSGSRPVREPETWKDRAARSGRKS